MQKILFISFIFFSSFSFASRNPENFYIYNSTNNGAKVSVNFVGAYGDEFRNPDRDVWQMQDGDEGRQIYENQYLTVNVKFGYPDICFESSAYVNPIYQTVTFEAIGDLIIRIVEKTGDAAICHVPVAYGYNTLDDKYSTVEVFTNQPQDMISCHSQESIFPTQDNYYVQDDRNSSASYLTSLFVHQY